MTPLFKTSDPKAWKRLLCSSLENNEIYMMYQPKYIGDKIVGIEALCRWNSPSIGSIPPSLFIPEAEASGYIVKLGSFALENSLRVLSQIHKVDKTVSISVNVSPLQFSSVHSTNFVQLLNNLTKQHGLPRGKVVVEVTEGHEIDRAVVLNTLSDIKSLGYRISLDDFGTGYSAFSIFNKISIDELKIDRGFIVALDTPKGEIIFDAIVKLGQNLGMTVVAEGVEDKTQFNKVSSYGNVVIQGFYLSKPLTEDELLSKFPTKN